MSCTVGLLAAGVTQEPLKRAADASADEEEEGGEPCCCSSLQMAVVQGRAGAGQAGWGTVGWMDERMTTDHQSVLKFVKHTNFCVLV